MKICPFKGEVLGKSPFDQGAQVCVKSANNPTSDLSDIHMYKNVNKYAG